MRHFFVFVVSTTMATLALLGCGSDSDDGNHNNAGSGGGHNHAGAGGDGGGSSLTQCVGNNAEFTPAEFIAQTLPDKACSSSSDVSTVCANNMPVLGGQCGKSCLGMSDEATCVSDCIQNALSAGSEPLSEECMACYTADIACAKTNCLSSCALAPTSAACLTCRTDQGCVATFYDCSGLPEPTSP